MRTLHTRTIWGCSGEYSTAPWCGASKIDWLGFWRSMIFQFKMAISSLDRLKTKGVVYKRPYEWNLGPAGNREGERIILGMIRSHTACQSKNNIVVETITCLQHSGHSIRKVQIDPRLRRYRVIDTFSVIAQEAGPACLRGPEVTGVSPNRTTQCMGGWMRLNESFAYTMNT